MTISEFYSFYPTEESCRVHLKRKREEQGLVCKKCDGSKHYWLRGKQQWQCGTCGFRTTLRSGTLFESSKLKLKIWFQALYLVCNSKKGISDCELQRQLGLKRNEPAWYMMHKIRKAMAQINEKQQISGQIEMDDAFFESIEDKGKSSLRIIQRGPATQKFKEKVLVMVESMMRSGEKSKGKIGKMRMLRATPVADFLWNIDGGGSAKGDFKTDRSRNRRIVEPHLFEPVVSSANKAFQVSPWVKTALGNSRRVIYGIYHHVSTKFAQLYLDEFCFKFNHRFHSTKWLEVFRHALNFSW